MKVKHGKGKTEYGPGVEIKLTGSEVAVAVIVLTCAKTCEKKNIVKKLVYT